MKLCLTQAYGCTVICQGVSLSSNRRRSSCSAIMIQKHNRLSNLWNEFSSLSYTMLDVSETIRKECKLTHDLLRASLWSEQEERGRFSENHFRSKYSFSCGICLRLTRQAMKGYLIWRNLCLWLISYSATLLRGRDFLAEKHVCSFVQEMKQLGDNYARNEFKQHKSANVGQVCCIPRMSRIGV